MGSRHSMSSARTASISLALASRISIVTRTVNLGRLALVQLLPDARSYLVNSSANARQASVPEMTKRSGTETMRSVPPHR